MSLNTLCDLYNAPKNPMKDQLKNIYRRDQKFWSRRPLSRDMLLYAAVDVLVLINTQLFAKMAEWVLHFSYDFTNDCRCRISSCFIFFPLEQFAEPLNRNLEASCQNFAPNKFSCWFVQPKCGCARNIASWPPKSPYSNWNCPKRTRILCWATVRFGFWGKWKTIKFNVLSLFYTDFFISRLVDI